MKAPRHTDQLEHFRSGNILTSKKIEILTEKKILSRFIFVSMFIISFDNILLYVFRLILNNWIIISTLFFASLLIIFIWREARDEFSHSNKAYIENLSYFTFFVFLLTLAGLIYIFIAKLFSEEVDANFKVNFLEGKKLLF